MKLAPRSANLARAVRPVFTAAPLAALTALHVFADDGFGGVVGTAFNLGLSAVLLAIVAYIGKFALEAVQEVGSQAGGRLEMIKGDVPSQRNPDEVIFDDSGDGADNSVPEKRKKQLVTEADIARMAPWMAGKIDQDKIEKVCTRTRTRVTATAQPQRPQAQRRVHPDLCPHPR